MNYWYRFKIKGIFDVDIIDAKDKEEATNKANKIADERIEGLKAVKVLECELDESGEWDE